MCRLLKTVLCVLVTFPIFIGGLSAEDSANPNTVIDTTPAKKNTNNKAAVTQKSTPPSKTLKTFEPSETISEDRTVSFPSDI